MVGERPPLTEADREGMRAYVDILKHLGTLSGAAVVAIGVSTRLWNSVARGQ